MECRKCKHWRFVPKDKFVKLGLMSKAHYYCRRLLEAGDLQERKSFCGGDYFEPKDNERQS